MIPKSAPAVEKRCRNLNLKKIRKGGYVLYWMQQSQRAEDNHALQKAIDLGNQLGQPVVVGFGLTTDYPEANLRHYRFMLEGLKETQEALIQKNIRMVLRIGEPHGVAIDLGKSASIIVCDRGYLRHQIEWRRDLARHAECRVVEVESDVVVPVETVSQKQEYAARTLRPKIHRVLDDWLVGIPHANPSKSSLPLSLEGEALADIDALLGRLSIDRSISQVTVYFKGGPRIAKKRFSRFLKERLNRYEINSNQPQTDDISHMSPYLHFGQISPLYLAFKVMEAEGVGEADKKAYLEQLIVRRELSMNYVTYQSAYDRYEGLPEWAKKTLGEHARDPRKAIYSPDQIESAETHDPYWNAAMEEMKITGFMHNYMRMYWAKKILEWQPDPEKAFDLTLSLNNRCFLDGRDPNSYVGVAWNYGLHDRPWTERPIFGKIRYMAASGLERKCDISAYVRKVERFGRLMSDKSG
jgi:deoxyribodipyrimidine photo-lyase